MVFAIIVAAGSGVRMNAAVAKQYLDLAGEPILLRTIRTFRECPLIDGIWLAVPPADVADCRNRVAALPPDTTPCHVISGGSSRQESVYRGLCAMTEDLGPDDLVAIHDGVRPLVSMDQIERCVESARGTGASILAIQVSDTVKKVDAGTRRIDGTLERQNLWLAQTPQVFRYHLIREAHERAAKDGIEATDDAMLIEISGGSVHIVPGSRENIKITTPEDLFLGETILRQRGKGKGRNAV